MKAVARFPSSRTDVDLPVCLAPRSTIGFRAGSWNYASSTASTLRGRYMQWPRFNQSNNKTTVCLLQGPFDATSGLLRATGWATRVPTTGTSGP